MPSMLNLEDGVTLVTDQDMLSADCVSLLVQHAESVGRAQIQIVTSGIVQVPRSQMDHMMRQKQSYWRKGMQQEESKE